MCKKHGQAGLDLSKWQFNPMLGDERLTDRQISDYMRKSGFLKFMSIPIVVVVDTDVKK